MAFKVDLNEIGNMNGLPFMEEEELNNPFAKTNEDLKGPKDSEKEKEEEETSEEESDEEENNEIIEEDEKDLLESVGDEEEEDDTLEDTGGFPDKELFYSSIAKQLSSDGIISLDEETLTTINNPEALAEAVKKQVDNLLTEEQKRIKKALEAKAPEEDISQYEKVLNFLDNIDEDSLTGMSDESVNLRKNIIYQDFINKGISKERAVKLVQQSFDTDADIDDALDALESNKKHYTSQYNEVIESNKNKLKEKQKEDSKKAEDLKKMFLNTEEPFEGFKLSKEERNKVYNKFSKFVDKDDKGNYITEIQKYALDSPEEYNYKINLIYYLTDGFKNIDKLYKDKVKSEKKSQVNHLENILKTPSGIDNINEIKHGNSKDVNSSIRGYSVKLD